MIVVVVVVVVVVVDSEISPSFLLSFLSFRYQETTTTRHISIYFTETHLPLHIFAFKAPKTLE
jgi:hypothetical protein